MAETDGFAQKRAEVKETRAAWERHLRRENPDSEELSNPVNEFTDIKEAAMKRLPAVKGMSAEAIGKTYPNLIKRVHYLDREILAEDGTSSLEATFTLWTAKGHALTAYGDIIQRVADEPTEAYQIVADADLDDFTRGVLQKTLASHTPGSLYVHVEPNIWEVRAEPDSGYQD